MTTALPLATARQDLWTGPGIDVDVHANVPSIEALYPYMDGLWVDWMVERVYRGPSAAATHYPPQSPRSCRPEWRPGRSEGAGSRGLGGRAGERGQRLDRQRVAGPRPAAAGLARRPGPGPGRDDRGDRPDG